MELEANRKRAPDRSSNGLKNLSAIASIALLRTGNELAPIFDDEEKARLVASITRDSRTRRLSWETICIEMDYACDPKTAKCDDFTRDGRVR